jgi:hypothetical protein
MLQSGINYRTAARLDCRSAQGKFLLSPVLFLIIHARIAGSSRRIFNSAQLATSLKTIGSGKPARTADFSSLAKASVREAGARSFRICPKMSEDAFVLEGQRRQPRVWETNDEQ